MRCGHHSATFAVRSSSPFVAAATSSLVVGQRVSSPSSGASVLRTVNKTPEHAKLGVPTSREQLDEAWNCALSSCATVWQCFSPLDAIGAAKVPRAHGAAGHSGSCESRGAVFSESIVRQAARGCGVVQRSNPMMATRDSLGGSGGGGRGGGSLSPVVSPPVVLRLWRWLRHVVPVRRRVGGRSRA